AVLSVAQSLPAVLLNLGFVPTATRRVGLFLLRQLLGDLGQFGDPLRQHVDILAARNAQGVQRARHSLLEHFLKLVPGPRRLLSHFGETLVGGSFRPLLEFLALSDESLEHLDTFLLGLGECSETSEPDLGRGFSHLSDLRSQLVFRGLTGEFLEFLWHDHPRFILAANPPFYGGSSLNGVGKAVFWVGLGSDRLGSSLL